LIGNRVIADIQKELAAETGDVQHGFPGLKREALVTIISADMQRYANIACGDARLVSSMPSDFSHACDASSFGTGVDVGYFPT
jgi:hypothetical protein